ncbi:phage portal protein [Streptomyces sp. Tu 2975]|uniref:phage portal protein n=1 Tax=Streptomyces sp. Tu 2975 TaxID=2676871 RepID=UPI00135C94B2|nr:phage portal protein [Streptomyces sp. Tu 2975]QIP87627.1 phage portal protein [Streptomyces sp. Tu 2975]
MARTLLGALLNRTATSTPVPFAPRSARYALGHAGRRDAVAQMAAMGSVGTLFSIVNRTSNATSQVDWKLWRKAKSGRDEDRVEVTSHAALDLWQRPNAFMPRQEFVEAFQQHIDLTGEGWWVIARHERSDIPLEMWYVRPDRIRPVPDPEHFLIGYMYTSPDGTEVPLELDQVIQLRMPNPLDPYRGMGPVQSILSDLDATKYSAEWNRNFFLNSAEPGGIIEVPETLSDPDFDQLRTRWNEQHRGVANAHRVAILEHGKWVDRKYTQRDMQFAELRSVSRDVIREAFGIPAFALGEVADVNRATAEASKTWFAEMLTVPRLERIKAALNHDLLPLFGTTAQGLEFDYCDPVPPDVETEAAQLTARANAAAALRTAGWDADDILSAVGLPDMRHTPPPAPSPAPAARQPQNWLPAGSTLLAAADDDAALEQIRQQYTTVLEQLLAEWEGIADEQIDQLADAITAAIDDDDLPALASITAPADRSTSVLAAALAQMATTAAEQMAAEAADQGVNITVPAVSSALTNRAWAFGDELLGIAQATAAILADDLARQAAIEAMRQYAPGAVGRRIADGVKTKLRGLKNRFRRDQLGAAVHRAQNVGRIAVVEATPAAVYTATEKLDGNTCPPCREIDGTEYTDLATIRALYAAGGYQQCEGGSRCRGTFTARWEASS